MIIVIDYNYPTVHKVGKIGFTSNNIKILLTC